MKFLAIAGHSHGKLYISQQIDVWRTRTYVGNIYTPYGT